MARKGDALVDDIEASEFNREKTERKRILQVYNKTIEDFREKSKDGDKGFDDRPLFKEIKAQIQKVKCYNARKPKITLVLPSGGNLPLCATGKNVGDERMVQLRVLEELKKKYEEVTGRTFDEDEKAVEADRESYNAYLDEIENIIYKRLHGSSQEKKQILDKIADYKKKNQKIIAKNKASAMASFKTQDEEIRQKKKERLDIQEKLRQDFHDSFTERNRDKKEKNEVLLGDRRALSRRKSGANREMKFKEAHPLDHLLPILPASGDEHEYLTKVKKLKDMRKRGGYHLLDRDSKKRRREAGGGVNSQLGFKRQWNEVSWALQEPGDVRSAFLVMHA